MLMETDLPEDMDALRALVIEQSRKLAEIAAAKGEADAEIERLQSIIDAFMRHRYGARSEQLDPDQLQLGLEDVETALGQARAAREAAAGHAGSDRPRKTNRGSLPAHLERIEQIVDVESVDGIRPCPCCGGTLHQIGEDVSERLDVVPTTFRVLVTRRPRYGCRSCEGAVVQALAPARIVEGGIPTEALIAQVLVAKYADHLPLYRQAQIYARQGIDLDRSTLADWVGRAAWYLRPLRDHTLERLRRSERLFADESTAPVLDPGRGRTKTGQLWTYARDDRPWGGGDPPMVAYVYAADRKSERAEAHLGDFAGILQVDGYGGYAALAKRRQQVSLAFCWAHVRRKFFELADTSPVATEVLRRITLLYLVEKEVRGQSAHQRRDVRNERSRVIIDDLHRHLEARACQVSAKAKLGEAIRYALTRWEGLSRFLDDGRIDLDSNSVERSIRPLALNRKNALFAGSDEGGDNWAVIATLIENCKLSGINPHTWLTKTLTKLANGHPANSVGQLMPWTDVG
ncbi:MULTISPECIES: IS66 family transposase [unclassified Novosphingobium]|uniref:IS66 family transposase n=1 Tax=unclassified Novosphingobium TaxID=2644732 RepID=UPI001493F79E|nr:MULTISPECIES: IS66 family transposase [unclassified Novosphingobium]MBB3359580.1 transposase [Novosphingobium sp. BK256]MBB3376054.1 transposase [Novosphingobium sp. BK280]MBB3380353.1 transposase [Novosphingobium sp. BK258]MBB3422005.1 transposase [Novosphingobium sp. BK267]MBB3450818.1 transposase [Novosphingobium sp. BK352]